MAFTTQQLITQLYVGYYNRAPDPEGLNYWIGRVNAGVSLADIADSFAASPEAIATYPFLALPNVASAESFLEQVYLNLFNRAIDDDGKAYYAEKLASGATTPGQIIAEIQANANTNPNNDDGTILANKVAVGLDWVNAAANTPGFEYNATAAASANTILDNVTADEASVTAAQAQIDTFFGPTGPGAGGDTFTLTDAIDNVVGTSGNDTILAGSQNGNDTLNAGDQINGGAGVDTLKIYAGLGNLGVTTIQGVEIIEAHVAGALDVSGIAGVEQGWSYKASVTPVTATKSQVIGFGDAAGGAAAVATFTSVGGTTDAATIAVKDAGKTTAYTSIAVSGIESLTVNATGANQLGNLIADAAETITVTGAGSVKATLAPGIPTVLKSVDASANTGGVDLTLTDAQFGANEIKVAGGAGNDKIAFTDALGAKATIDLGEGNNTLTLVQGVTALTAGTTIKAGSGTSDTLVLDNTTTGINGTTGKFITGFENIKLVNGSSYKVGDIVGITGFELGAGNNTLTNAASGVQVKVSGNGAQVVTLADNSAATSAVSLSLNNGAVIAANGVVGSINTNAHVLNIASDGLVNATANQVTLLGDALAQVTNIITTGSQALNVITGAATALTLVDGAAATGKLDIDLATATKSIVVKGGSAADTIKASDVAGVVSTITGGAGGDTITLGATAANNQGDVLKLTGQADSTAAGFDKVSNFAAATTTPANADKLDVSAFGFAGAQASAFTLGAAQVAVTGNGAAATFAIADSAATDFFLNAGADKGIALYTTATETFVFIDADKNGNWDAATDSVVLLVGNYSVDLLTQAGNFVF